MTFKEFLKRDVPKLGRPLSPRETAFLQAAEAAGFEFDLDGGRSREPHFFLETVEENPMNYPLTAAVRVETIELLYADSPEVRATIRRLIAEVNESVE